MQQITSIGSRVRATGEVDIVLRACSGKMCTVSLLVLACFHWALALQVLSLGFKAVYCAPAQWLPSESSPGCLAHLACIYVEPVMSERFYVTNCKLKIHAVHCRWYVEVLFWMKDLWILEIFIISPIEMLVCCSHNPYTRDTLRNHGEHVQVSTTGWYHTLMGNGVSKMWCSCGCMLVCI